MRRRITRINWFVRVVRRRITRINWFVLVARLSRIVRRRLTLKVILTQTQKNWLAFLMIKKRLVTFFYLRVTSILTSISWKVVKCSIDPIKQFYRRNTNKDPTMGTEKRLYTVNLFIYTIFTYVKKVAFSLTILLFWSTRSEKKRKAFTLVESYGSINYA